MHKILQLFHFPGRTFWTIEQLYSLGSQVITNLVRPGKILIRPGFTTFQDQAFDLFGAQPGFRQTFLGASRQPGSQPGCD